MSVTEPNQYQTDRELLTHPFPQEAVKQRELRRGGPSVDYIDGATVINRLNAATSNHWDMAVLRLWQEGDILYAHVRLSLPGLGAREHIGVQKIQPGASEDVAKGAVTDAMKKAATLFGVALELYGPDYGGPTLPDEATRFTGTSSRVHTQAVRREANQEVPDRYPDASGGRPLNTEGLIAWVRDCQVPGIMGVVSGMKAYQVKQAIEKWVQQEFGVKAPVSNQTGEVNDKGYPVIYPSDIYNYLMYWMFRKDALAVPPADDHDDGETIPF